MRDVYMHWQNLNERRDGEGSILRHGRAWLRLWRTTIGWEWVLGRLLAFGFGVGADGDEGRLTAHIKVPLFTLYVYLEGWHWPIRMLGLDFASAKRRREKKGGYSYQMDRELSLRVHDGIVWWTVWMSDMEHNSSDPWWRRGNLHVVDLLLGKERYSIETLSEREVVVPLPEASYPAIVTLTRQRWSRPLWPARVSECAQVDFSKVKGVPVPGKGEDAHNCGPDAIWSMGVKATTVEEAIGETVKRVLQSRVRYGGAHDYAERD